MMNRNVIKGFILISVLMILSYITIRVGNIHKMVGDGNLFKISTPYNGYSETIYYTKSYVEENGCVKFLDDWGKKRKICGTYLIEEY